MRIAKGYANEPLILSRSPRRGKGASTTDASGTGYCKAISIIHENKSDFVRLGHFSPWQEQANKPTVRGDRSILEQKVFVTLNLFNLFKCYKSYIYNYKVYYTLK